MENKWGNFKMKCTRAVELLRLGLVLAERGEEGLDFLFIFNAVEWNVGGKVVAVEAEYW